MPPSSKQPQEPTVEARTTNLRDVEPRAVRWLWPARFPLGRLSILQGDPDCGKSFLSLDISARVSAGLPWPDDIYNLGPAAMAGPADVILLSAEDDPADTIRPRLDAMGADCSRITMLDGVKICDTDGKEKDYEFNLQGYAAQLDDVIQEKTPKLVVIDPLSAYLGETDSHKNAEMRGLLRVLGRIAEERQCAILCIHHLNKTYGGKAIYRGQGSLAITAAARTVWHAGHDPNDEVEDQADRRKLLLSVKCNIDRRPPGMAYRITSEPAIEWLDCNIKTTADEIIQERKPGPPATERDAAADAILEVLQRGTVSAKDLESQVLAAGVKAVTFQRARKQLREAGRITSSRTAGTTHWVLANIVTGTPPEEHEELDELDDVSRHISSTNGQHLLVRQVNQVVDRGPSDEVGSQAQEGPSREQPLEDGRWDDYDDAMLDGRGG